MLFKPVFVDLQGSNLRFQIRRKPWGLGELTLIQRSVPLCFWKTVAHRYPVEEEQMHRRPQRTRRSIRNWVPVTTPLCLRNRGPAKQAKGDERCGLGGPCHIARPDIGRGRDALLRDPAWHVQKNSEIGTADFADFTDLRSRADGLCHLQPCSG